MTNEVKNTGQDNLISPNQTDGCLIFTHLGTFLLSSNRQCRRYYEVRFVKSLDESKNVQKWVKIGQPSV